MRKTLITVFCLAVSVIAYVATGAIELPSAPGVPVARSEASRVLGTQMGSVGVVMQVTSTSFGCTVAHEKLTKTTYTTYCSGSTYSGCGGGACGTVDVYGLNLVGNQGNDVAGSCSSKSCGMTQVTCGSPTLNGCI